MSKKYFGTDGIRGKVNQGNINGEMFFKFGLAAGTYFKNLKKNKQIAIIAKDTRLSGYTLEPALVSGLASAGMHVYTLGPLPTNGLAMLTKSMNANLGIMITASHNLFYDNDTLYSGSVNENDNVTNVYSSFRAPDLNRFELIASSVRVGLLFTVQSKSDGPFKATATSVQAISTHCPSPEFCLCKRAARIAIAM